MREWIDEDAAIAADQLRNLVQALPPASARISVWSDDLTPEEVPAFNRRTAEGPDAAPEHLERSLARQSNT